MSDPKKHHFSPEFYLRGWCNSTTGQLTEYSRRHEGVVPKNVYPAATGYKPFLYTMEGRPDGQKQTIEKDYMAPKVDAPAAKALQVLLGADTSALTEELREAWTRFMIASLLRRPAGVAEIGETFKNALRRKLLADSSYELDKQEGDPPTRFEWMQKHHPHWIEDTAKQMMVRMIESAGVGNIIINMQWATLDMSSSRHYLLTGDMPHLRYYGLKDLRCTILFPLTPTKLFIATHDRKAERNINCRDKTAVVRGINDEIARLAERFVYGRNASQLRFVANRLGRTRFRLPDTVS